MKYLIAGLGNIGPQYELTRHNIGFLVLDQMAEKNKLIFASGRHAFHCEFRYKGRSITLIKPTTFMNLSGKAINFWMKDLKVPLENILVVTDDLALPFGKLRLRAKGSNGGHNGLGNIQEVLGTDVYARLRFGVGSDFPKGRQIDYVLSNFATGELVELPLYTEKAMNACLDFCTVGISQAMTIYNKG